MLQHIILECWWWFLLSYLDFPTSMTSTSLGIESGDIKLGSLFSCRSQTHRHLSMDHATFPNAVATCLFRMIHWECHEFTTWRAADGRDPLIARPFSSERACLGDCPTFKNCTDPSPIFDNLFNFFAISVSKWLENTALVNSGAFVTKHWSKNSLRELKTLQSVTATSWPASTPLFSEDFERLRHQFWIHRDIWTPAIWEKNINGSGYGQNVPALSPHPYWW